MVLTPSDVEDKTFGTALRGYDLDEVDEFLDEVVATIKDLQDQLAEARSAQPEPAAPEAVVDESAIGRALVTAQQTADQIIQDAKAESERIVAEARDQAESYENERSAKKAEAEAEMAELSRHVSNIRAQLAVLATAVADRLDEMDATIEVTSDAVIGADDESDGEAEELAESFDLEEIGGGNTSETERETMSAEPEEGFADEDE